MNKKATALLVVVAFASTASGYDTITHSRLSEVAVERSVLNDASSGVLATLCAAESADDRRCLLRSSSPFTNPLTPIRLIREGAVREDDGDRAVNHFFDPQNGGAPLQYPFGVDLGDPSPDWALEDRFDIEEQSWSLSDAKDGLYAALTRPWEAERSAALGAVFETLGHVIHHLQDMAQPQHVRNDIHCDRFFSTWFAPLPVPGVCAIGLAHRPSAYEAFTRQRGREIPLAPYRLVDFATFGQPRQFWASAGKGIAEFASNNFVSDGTNFYRDQDGTRTRDGYPNPGVVVAEQRREITDSDLLGPNQPLTGELWFISTPIIDQYDREASGINHRASTYSLFSSDLQRRLDQNPRVTGFYSLNRFNHAAANEFLLPRAAAYSTGLINYFFRGRIEIGLPADGVYGVIDHATTYAAGQGFDKLKLRLRNASPDGVKPDGERVPQTMQGGTLVAIAKYTLNSCYLPDLTGDFAVTIDTGEVIYPAGCWLDLYFSGDEQISQSSAILAASLDTTAATELTFDFSSQPIPINARDLRVQVLYTGQLGAEAAGIAFGGRNISEPTHVIVYNNSDYFAVDGRFYTPEQIRSDPALSERVAGRNIDPAPLAAVTMTVVPGRPLTGTAGPVPVNGYVRLAVLADVDQPFPLHVVTSFEGQGSTTTMLPEIWAATTELREEPVYITPFGIYRGTRAHFIDVVFKANSTAPLHDGELVTMSGRTVADPGPTPIPLRF